MAGCMHTIAASFYYVTILILQCKHLATISLGLEAHWLGMDAAAFQSFLAGDCPGPNKDHKKANQMQTFSVPAQFIEDCSSPNKAQTLTIFLALISGDYVWALVDFSRLVRIHIISRAQMWTEYDLKTSSAVCHKYLLTMHKLILACYIGMVPHLEALQRWSRLDARALSC